MSTIARSSSASRFRLLALLAALGCGAALLSAGAGLAASAGAAPEPAAVDGLEEPDGPELDEQRHVDLVADAQRLLQLSGYDPGPIDGRIGLRTQRAIRAYQAAARRGGTLEALKGPGRDDGAPRPELVGVDQAAPDRAR